MAVQDGEMVVICGSLYLASEALQNDGILSKDNPML